MDSSRILSPALEQLFQFAQHVKERNRIRDGKVDLELIEKKYVIYARKSSTDEGKQVHSIDQQVTECKKFASEHGLKVVEVITEEQSAKVAGKRDKFYTMLQNIEDQKYNSILAWHPDRLARNMKDAGEIIDWLDRYMIVDLKFPSYTFVNDPSGKMALGIQFVLAKNYSDGLSVNTKRGNDGNAQAGLYMGKAKHGYKEIESRYRVDSEYFQIMRKGWDMLFNEEPLRKVGHYLKDNYKEIKKTALSRIFADPFYAGVLVHGDNIVYLPDKDSGFTPMVTPDEFLKVRSFLNDNRAFQRTKSEAVMPLFNGGFCICGYCGKGMVSGISQGKTNKYMYIRCNNPNCDSRSYSYNSTRGEVPYQFIINMLKDGIQVERPQYEQILANRDKVLMERMKDIEVDLDIYQRQLLDKNKLKESYALQVVRVTNKEVPQDEKDRLINKLNDDLDELLSSIVDLEVSIAECRNQIEALNHSKGFDNVTFENYLNFFEKAHLYLEKLEDYELADNLIKMIYLNLTLKDKKVIAYKLLEPFASYEKVRKPLLG